MDKVWISNVATQLDREMENALEWLDWRAVIAMDAGVAIKPNFTYPTHKAGVTTSPVIIESLIRALRTRTKHIVIVESDGGCGAWTAEQAFEGHDIFAMCRRYGVRAVNLTSYPRARQQTEIAGRTLSVELSRLLAREIEVLVTMPVPKLHAMTGVSLGFKNQWGCLPDPKRLHHHADFAATVLGINKLLSPRLAVFDGTWFLDRNGPLEGQPIRRDLLIASRSIGAASSVCCALMGINPRSITHLRLAMSEGMMPSSIRDIASNQPLRQFAGPAMKLRRTALQWLTLCAFHNRFATKLLYDSPVAGPIHEILYTLRGRPADFSPRW